MQEYFSHDIFTRENLKIKRLINTHKMEGYGVFWAVIEFLHNNNNRLLMSELDIIAFDLGVDVSLVESVIKNFNLFNIRKKVVSSARVAKNIKLRKEKTEKARKKANKRWENNSGYATALPQQCYSNAIKEKESKEKESKEKESKEKESKEKESKEKESKEKESKEKESKEKESKEKESKEKESKEKESKEKESKEKESKVNESEVNAKQEKIDETNYTNLNSGLQTSDTNKHFFNFYGTANNVHLTCSQYDSLVSLYGKEVVDTVISELSYKISTGKEQEFNAELPNAHFARLERYARQKISTTGTSSRASGAKSKTVLPSVAAETTENCSQNDDNTSQTEEKFVPPPPEFFEAGERLRRMANKRTL